MLAAEPLQTWMDRQFALSARRMAACVSATGLVKHRPGFGMTVVPAPGSVVASPVLADYDPDPDYFFHWIRDSALVMDAAVRLAAAGDETADWAGHIRDHVRFSLGLAGLRGRDVLEHGGPRARARPDFLQFVRPDEELVRVEGDRIPGEVRFAPDGTLDTIRWGRPQHDGPALRALTLMRADAAGFGCDGLEALLRADLDYTADNAGAACIDLWEDVTGRHYHTQIVQFAALRRGATRIAASDPAAAMRRRSAAAVIPPSLEACWSETARCYLSREAADPAGPSQPDIAVVLGVLHAALEGGRHSVLDERVTATLAELARRFAADYAINADRPEGHAPALGRFRGDRYYSGGAYHFATLAAAEFHYRRSRAARSAEDARSECAAGDAYMSTVRRFAREDGALAEQFDQRTGEPSSAKDLGWSHAAFVTAHQARRAAASRG
ncbi:glucoamylase [Constrictibacter sp. MBR-5]|jgi:glucoamylase|uniref:glycoside hydrolase family 15 protein n=1 Tax=Constrictibacter sp. MBR-5 TaxID=3156467 RepID=UPI003399EC53